MKNRDVAPWWTTRRAKWRLAAAAVLFCLFSLLLEKVVYEFYYWGYTARWGQSWLFTFAPEPGPLHVAAEKGNIKRMRRILATFPELVNQDSCELDSPERDCLDGGTPLDFAIKSGSLEAVKLLVEHGAFVKYGALYMAVGYDRDIHIAEYLISQGASVSGDGSYETPLHKAAIYSPKMTKMLLEHGAPVNAVASNGETPLHNAARQKDARTLDLLLQYGANVHARSMYGDTPLHDAAFTCSSATVKALIQAGADVNAKDDSKRTPLHNLVYHANESDRDSDVESIAHTLLSSGADINARDDQGETPLSLAIATQNQIVVRLLSQRGAQH